MQKTGRETGRIVVCTGGVHIENITKEQIHKLLEEI